MRAEEARAEDVIAAELAAEAAEKVAAEEEEEGLWT